MITSRDKKKIFCFGELLLRFSPALQGRWINESSMPIYVGGAELNVTTALAGWGLPTKYCTAIPDHYLSHEILNSLQKKNIDITPVLLSGERIGSYYLPQGSDLKHAGVIYDRAHSSFWNLRPGTIDWNEALKDCSWFHFSAISPALNPDAAAVCSEAVNVASAKGLTISVDLNYRSKLWKYEKKPIAVMPGLVSCCNIIMGNIWSANELLGIPLDANIHSKKSKDAYLEHANNTARHIMEKFPGCVAVANTFRFDEGEGISYYASLDAEGHQVVSPEFSTQQVVDKVGSGDCFMGGLIYGLYRGLENQDVINFAAAAAFGKLQEKGDTTSQTVADVERLIHKIFAKG